MVPISNTHWTGAIGKYSEPSMILAQLTGITQRCLVITLAGQATQMDGKTVATLLII